MGVKFQDVAITAGIKDKINTQMFHPSVLPLSCFYFTKIWKNDSIPPHVRVLRLPIPFAERKFTFTDSQTQQGGKQTFTSQKPLSSFGPRCTHAKLHRCHVSRNRRSSWYEAVVPHGVSKCPRKLRGNVLERLIFHQQLRIY